SLSCSALRSRHTTPPAIHPLDLHDALPISRPDAYFEPTNWHRTALHELGHWTGAAQRLVVISPAASVRRNMPRRSWSRRSPAPSCVLPSASCQRCATPTILASGSRSCDRTIALSFPPPALRPSRQTTSSRPAQSPTNAKVSDQPTISSSAIDRRHALDEAPRCPRRRGRPRFEGGHCRRDGSHQARKRSVATRHGDTTMRMSDHRTPGDYNDYYIPRIFRNESTTHPLDQAILFTACDALGHDALQKAISPTRQIDHWLASDRDEKIIWGGAEDPAAGENSECRAHDNLNAIPLAASTGDKAAALAQ